MTSTDLPEKLVLSTFLKPSQKMKKQCVILLCKNKYPTHRAHKGEWYEK